VRLHTDVPGKRFRILVLMVLLWPRGFVSAAAAPAPQPTPAEIARALEIVKTDPSLAPFRTIRVLRWRNSSNPVQSSVPAWLAWVVDLVRWLDQTARFLVWGLVLALAVGLAAYLTRLVGRRTDYVSHRPVVTPPIRVHDLDIRPESLPDDIGAAARQLWNRSEHRAALALLYRGMLSRFAHVHQIPIRDSTTEADCLVLAGEHLEPTRSEYATHLVRIWQRAVYGREDIEDSEIYRLCDGFGAALDRAALTMSGRGA